MLHMMFDVFSGWFFLSLAMLFIVEMVSVNNNEEAGWPFLWLAVWAALTILFTDFRPWAWGIDHWVSLLLGCFLYVVAGVAWAMLKWSWYVQDFLLRTTMSDPLTDLEKSLINPAMYDNRSKITTWMLWWPFSVLWFVCKWPREVFNRIYAHLIGTFNRITDRAVQRHTQAQHNANSGI